MMQDYPRPFHIDFKSTYGSHDKLLPHSYDDIPAIRVDGSDYTMYRWFDQGNHHRDHDLPAVIYVRNDGEIDADRYEWYQYGNRHRDGDEPAYISGDAKVWYKNGWAHRIGAPASITKNYEEWLVKGQRHRLDGPAYTNFITGEAEWYVYDLAVTNDVKDICSQYQMDINDLSDDDRFIISTILYGMTEKLRD